MASAVHPDTDSSRESPVAEGGEGADFLARPVATRGCHMHGYLTQPSAFCVFEEIEELPMHVTPAICIQTD